MPFIKGPARLLGTLGRAPAEVFLPSDEAAFITGVELLTDG
jgi:hypothetical protein